jgi:hypothetical protein
MYVSAPAALHPKCDLTHAPIFDVLKSGAGDGNRTHGSSLGSLGITIIRRPRLASILVAFRKIRQPLPIEATGARASGAPAAALGLGFPVTIHTPTAHRASSTRPKLSLSGSLRSRSAALTPGAPSQIGVSTPQVSIGTRQPILSRRIEYIDVKGVFERHRAMREVGRL